MLSNEEWKLERKIKTRVQLNYFKLASEVVVGASGKYGYQSGYLSNFNIFYNELTLEIKDKAT